MFSLSATVILYFLTSSTLFCTKLLCSFSLDAINLGLGKEFFPSWLFLKDILTLSIRKKHWESNRTRDYHIFRLSMSACPYGNQLYFVYICAQNAKNGKKHKMTVIGFLKLQNKVQKKTAPDGCCFSVLVSPRGVEPLIQP